MATETPVIRTPDVDLSDRELAVLGEITREADGSVAFQGIRRRLRLHQQALTRTLRRLQRSGLVERTERGYQATHDGYVAARPQPDPAGDPAAHPLVRAALPGHLEPSVVAHHLARRWFRGLRWYGESYGPGELVLLWLAEPGDGLVRVRIAGGAFALEAEDATVGARAARAILPALAELYGLPPSADGDWAAPAPTAA